MPKPKRQVLYKNWARKLWALLVEGMSEEEARDSLCRTEAKFTEGRYPAVKECMFALQAELLQSQSTERVYAEYVLRQLQNVYELTDAVEKAKGKGNTPVIVGAVRARGEIWDRLIKVGQEFGVLERKPEEKRIIAGVMVANLSDVQLRQAITSELSGLDKLVRQFGDRGITELEPGALHYALPEAQKSRTHKAKANKVHKGRRVVKEKLLQ